MSSGSPHKPPISSPTGPVPDRFPNRWNDPSPMRDRRSKKFSIGSSVRSMSEYSEEGVGPLMDQVISLNLPMPAEFSNTSPSMSRSSSKRMSRRMSLSSDCMEEGIGEALHALSRSLSRRGSKFQSSYAPKLHKQQSSSSVHSAQGALSMIPGVPVTTESTSEDVVKDKDTLNGSKRLESMDLESRAGESRSSTPFSDDEFDKEEVECTDVGDLQKSLKFRLKQLHEAVEMGHRIFNEMKQVREEAMQITEDRDQLVEDNEELLREQLEYTNNLKRIAHQLADAKAENSRLLTIINHEREDKEEINKMMEKEKEKHERKTEELIENAKWQEEKFVAVKNAAERAAPGNAHVIAMKAALQELATRQRYFKKLSCWRTDNGKRRQCYHILRHNLYNELAVRSYIRDVYFQRLKSLGLQRMESKRQARLALEDEEHAARNVLEQDSGADLAEAFNNFASLGVVAWQVAVEESETHTHALKGERDHATECALLGEFEQKWRYDLLSLTWQGVSTLYGSALGTAMDEWRSCHRDREEKKQSLECVREQWDSETTSLREACATRDTELHELSVQIKEADARAASAEAVVTTHEREIGKLRSDKSNLSIELIAMRESLETADADLSKARAQLEFQHDRAKARAGSLQGPSAVTPCIKQAISLVATLRQKTEDTRNLAMSPSPSPQRNGYSKLMATPPSQIAAPRLSS